MATHLDARDRVPVLDETGRTRRLVAEGLGGAKPALDWERPGSRGASLASIGGGDHA